MCNSVFSHCRNSRDLRHPDLLLAKSKQEAQFQLANLLSILPVGTDILLWVKTAVVYVAQKKCWQTSRS